MQKYLIALLVGIFLFGSGGTIGWIKGRQFMQADIDRDKVLAQIKATEETIQNAADERKARFDAQQAEDALHALPDTGGQCINPNWVR